MGIGEQWEAEMCVKVASLQSLFGEERAYTPELGEEERREKKQIKIKKKF